MASAFTTEATRRITTVEVAVVGITPIVIAAMRMGALPWCSTIRSAADRAEPIFQLTMSVR
uniref:Uncharacterized protein n=1 Tax=Romanomermis culicivorax TaxID=13658 RepID=A0A915IZY3_ROMCU